MTLSVNIPVHRGYVEVVDATTGLSARVPSVVLVNPATGEPYTASGGTGGGGGGDASAANQAVGNASLAAISAVTGAQSDAVASSDTGAFSLVALVKRLLGKFTPTVPVDRSGTTSATVSTATNAIAANASRRGWSIQNLHATAYLYVNDLGTATAGTGSFALAPGREYYSPSGQTSQSAISVLATVASVPFTAREW